jgi:hypothetical protein
MRSVAKRKRYEKTVTKYLIGERRLKMRKTIPLLALALVLGLTLYPIHGRAQMGPGYGMGPGMMGYGYGGYGMGPGMMGYGYGGYGMGPGMMAGPGYGCYGMGPWMMPHYGMGYGYGYGYGPQYQEREKPLTEDDAKTMVENYLKSTKNPNLKLGKTKNEEHYFEVHIVTKKNDALVDKILVDKSTGWMHSIY